VGRRHSAAKDIEGETEISLEEAYTGSTLTVDMSSAEGPRRVEVKIPAGISDGARVRVKGQGPAGAAGGAAGDLFIRVKVRPHPRFKREGNNIRLSVKMPLRAAIAGGEVEVKTPAGKRVNLKIPRETQNGKVLRMRGLGMPHLGGGGHGDLLAEVEVEAAAAGRSRAQALGHRRLELGRRRLFFQTALAAWSSPRSHTRTGCSRP